MNRPSPTASRGVALVLVLLVTSFLSAIVLGLAIVVSTAHMAERNVSDAAAMLGAADAGVEVAARDLARESRWDLVLSGVARSPFVDGAPTGIRTIPGGGSVSLIGETNQLNCGRVSACTRAQMAAITRDRPWGANNPTWQLFGYGLVKHAASFARPTPGYLILWLADDSREGDGDPLVDEVNPAGSGHGVVRVRAEVFGVTGSRRAVEAELTRVCRVLAGRQSCLPGIRVQSWREVRQILP